MARPLVEPPTPSAAEGRESLRVSAPGKCILFGEHAVVHGQTAIAVSLDIRTRLEMTCGALSDDGDVSGDADMISLHLDNFECGLLQWSIPRDLSVSYDDKPLDKAELDSLATRLMPSLVEEDENVRVAWMAVCYLFVAIRALQPSTPLITGDHLHIHVDSDLHVGAGLGSSASFSTCIATAFLFHFGVLDRHAVVNAVNYRNSKLSHSNAALINRWALCGERVIHGHPSGLDNTLCVYGGAMAFCRGRPFHHLDLAGPLQFVLTNTGQPRQTSVMVQRVSDLYAQFPRVVASIMDSINAISEQFELRVLQEVRRDEYSREFYAQMESLMDINQRLLSALGVSHESIDCVVDCMLSEYGLHSKLTGAGGGGCVLSLVNPYTHPQLDDYDIEPPSDMDSSLVQLGGGGVALLVGDDEPYYIAPISTSSLSSSANH